MFIRSLQYAKFSNDDMLTKLLQYNTVKHKPDESRCNEEHVGRKNT